MDLSDYFAKLCFDDTYTEPTAVAMRSTVEIPEISERQVWNSLRALKRTATGPDHIPYWLGKTIQRYSRQLSPGSGIFNFNFYAMLAIIVEEGKYNSPP